MVASVSRKVTANVALPLEIIREIYDYLSPQDFNTARHTCIDWWCAGLDRLLLMRMLKRAGWWSSAINELGRLQDHISAEFDTVGFLSHLFVRECALQEDWRRDEKKESMNRFWSNLSTFHLAYKTDFTELSCESFDRQEAMSFCSLNFTTSVCGNFILVFEGCIIYVYELNDTEISPVTCLICPQRVMAVSMDTSWGSRKIAALLEERTGLVCDLDYESNNGKQSHQSFKGDNLFEPLVDGRKTSSSQYANFVETMSRLTRLEEVVSNIHGISIQFPIQKRTLMNNSRLSDKHTTNSTPQNILYPVLRSNQSIGNETYNGIPICLSPLYLYHSLGSSEDPPRSVAICPSWRCVAFGCATGMELHWMDRDNGRHCTKWFPLTVPSDCLYFLPSRPGFDNPNKLRLISSKAGPYQRRKIGKIDRLKKSEAYSLSWSMLQLDTGSSTGYDHYNAIPLSDGINILFTDPTNDTLCLGCDAPFAGSTKLLRKIIFVPPEEVQQTYQGLPTIYTAATDLTWGVRVVAAYGYHLVLYCVPNDMFLDLKHIRGKAISPANDEEEPHNLGEWAKWWNFDLIEFASCSRQPSAPTPWYDRPVDLPIPVNGIYIAKVPGIVEIAIQINLEPTIWTFTADGIARTWQLNDNQETVPIERIVGRDGLVKTDDDQKHGIDFKHGQVSILDGVNESCGEKCFVFLATESISSEFHGVEFDRDGDVIMTDMDNYPLHNTDCGAFVAEGPATVNGPARYDTDGDVIMSDAWSCFTNDDEAMVPNIMKSQVHESTSDESLQSFENIFAGIEKFNRFSEFYLTLGRF